MRTHTLKNLFFSFRSVIPERMSTAEFAELLVHQGLIEALERDLESGEIVRYAELPVLYKSPNKERIVREALLRLEGAR